MHVGLQVLLFGSILLYTKILNEWQDSFDRKQNQNLDLFTSCVLLTCMTAGMTLKKTEKPAVLGREQTNEWKGWMQIMFLLYHYYRGTWIYNEIRVFVSCYVWMTGFGNFIYFTKKQDFSLKRVVTTIIRINLLTVGLMIFNGTSMMLYYVVPLHTGFFLMTYAACWCIHVSNKPITVLGLNLGVLMFLFEVWRPFGGEVEFRFGLDRYSAWWGMVSAYILMYHKKTMPPTVAAVLGLACMTVWYVIWGYEIDKYTYNPSHPYIVILPIVGYILLRNCHPVAREYYSSAMAWFGGITLETYVLQFHILMCHNVKHILVLCPLPVLNTCVVSILFIAVSWAARQVTIELQTRINQLLSKREITYAPV